jgi:hypothetical protein
MDPGRARILFAVVPLAGFVVVVVLLALPGGGGDGRATGLTLRIDPNQNVVTAYVDASELPAVAGAKDAVRFECRDRAGKLLVRSSERWPFTDTDGGTTAPHVHVNVPGIEKLATCEVLGTNPRLGGELGSTRPAG